MLRQATRHKNLRKALSAIPPQGRYGSAFPRQIDVVTTAIIAAGLTYRVNVPTLDLQSGDLLIAAIRSVAGAGAWSWPSGWTELVDSTADGSVDSLGVAYRFVSFDADEDGNMSPSLSGGNQAAPAVCWCFRDAGTPQVSSVVSASTNVPNPPSLTPAGGAKNYLWMALTSGEGTRTVSAYPTNYSLYQLDYTTGTGGGGNAEASIHAAFRENNTATEDPGAFTLSAIEDTMTVTIAIPPA